MKEKKKTGMIVFSVSCIIIVTICLIIQLILNQDTERLKKESKKYETLITETKSGEKIETEYTHVEDAKFYIKIPKSFRILNHEEINQKYNGKVPNIVFSNEEMTINVAISMTDDKMPDAKIKFYHQNMNEVLKENNEIIGTKLYQVDGHTLGQIKLLSNATDTKIYNNMIYFSYQDKLVIVTFNCIEEEREEWQEVGEFIIDSLFFKK